MGLNLGSIAKGMFNPVANFLNPVFGVGSGGLLGQAGNIFGDFGLGPSQAGTTTTIQDVPDWQKPFINNGLYAAGTIGSQSTSPMPQLNAAQDEYFNTVGGQYLHPGSNPYLDATFNQAARGVTDAYQNTVKPRTDSAFFGPGSMGGNSAYHGQVARNNYGLGQNLTDLATNIYGGNYQQERNRQFAATSSAPSFVSGYNQARFSPISSYMDVVGRPFGSSTSEPYFKNDTAGLLGLGSLGLAAYGMLSDRRMKSNIVRVGTHPLGIGIYEYDVFGKRERGVMADEVEKVRPGAVVEVGGIKHVVYEALS